MKPALLVLAAGMGSRYGGLKQIDPVGEHGETIIDFSVFDAIQAGFENVVFVIRKDIEKDFRETVGKKYERKIDTSYVFQNLDDIPGNFSIPAGRTKPWGTGHAILCASLAIDSPFAVINGDDFYGRDSFNILGDYLCKVNSGSGEYAMAAYILKNTLSEHGHVSRGICALEGESYLKNIVEHTKIEKSGGKILSIKENGEAFEFSGNEYVSMNMFGFTPWIFEHLRREFHDFLKNNINNVKAEFYIPSVVSYLIRKNLAKVKVLRSNASWLGITYQEDRDYVRKSVKKLINEGVYPKNLWG